MEQLIVELVIYGLLWLIVIGGLAYTASKLIRSHWASRKQNQLLQHQLEVKKHLVPYQLQAAERLVLLVERIRPEGLVNRMAAGESTAAGLQLAMLAQIRMEMEHNLAQQVYVQARVWQAVITARDEVLGIIHRAAAQTPPNDAAIQFSRNLFQVLQQQPLTACDQAIQSLRNEIQQLQHD
jgi:hypothetical protein